MLKDRLKEQRKRKKILQNEMADKLGISQSAYSHYEQGKRIPDAITLNKMADILDTTTDYLLGRTATTNIIDSGYLTDGDAEQLADEIIEIYIKKGKIKRGEKLTPEIKEKILREIEAFIDMTNKLEGN